MNWMLVMAALYLPFSGDSEKLYEVDRLSFKLGSISAFSEMVAVGVKPLGLSSPLISDEMDAIMASAREITDKYKVELYRDRDFLVTDLFPANATEGKDVLVIATKEALARYHELKRQKQSLQATNTYEGQAREQLARAFGTLLGYPRWRIDQLLAKP